MFNKIAAKVKILLLDKDERNLFINILLAFIVKGFSFLLSIFSMPLYIRYFDNNSILGVWYTILSMLSWISIMDLGLGSGLRNYFAKAYARNDIVEGKKYISSTYVALTVIVLPIIIMGCIFIPFLNLNDILKVSNTLVDHKSLATAIIILLIGLGFNFVIKSITSIIYAIQKSSINNFISLIVSVIPLLYILIDKGDNTLAKNLIYLSIVQVISINLPLIIASIIIFSGKYRNYAISINNFDMSTAKSMLSMGLNFFSAQIFFMLLMSTNEIFITRLYSSDDVVEYSIYYKIFMLIGSLFMLALTPLWSKVTKDLEEKKYQKIKITNKVLYVISAAAIFSEFLIIPFLQWIFNFWLKTSSIKVDASTAFIFAIYGGMYILNIVLTTVANGMGELKTQKLFYGIGALLKLPVILLLKSLYNNWNVIVLYNCVVLFVFCIFQIIWLEKKLKELIR